MESGYLYAVLSGYKPCVLEPRYYQTMGDNFGFSSKLFRAACPQKFFFLLMTLLDHAILQLTFCFWASRHCICTAFSTRSKSSHTHAQMHTHIQPYPTCCRAKAFLPKLFTFFSRILHLFEWRHRLVFGFGRLLSFQLHASTKVLNSFFQPF